MTSITPIRTLPRLGIGRRIAAIVAWFAGLVGETKHQKTLREAGICIECATDPIFDEERGLCEVCRYMDLAVI